MPPAARARRALLLALPLLLGAARAAAGGPPGAAGGDEAAGDGHCSASSGPASCVRTAVDDEAAAGREAEHPPPAPSSEEGLDGGAEELPRREVHVRALIILGCLVVPMMVWMGCIIKFAWDGSLPARLALWGLLPEAYAAVSVRAVAALLRLKRHASTPVVVLRNCITDENAAELAEAVRLYGDQADLQALELQWHPGLGESGLRLLAEVAMDRSSKLEEFDLAYNPQLRDFLVPVLAPLLKPRVSKMNTLKLADCGLCVEHVRALAAGIDRTKLKILDLTGNHLAGGGEALAEVCEAPLLEDLTLAGCGLTAEDVSALADQLPFTTIKSLQLGGNGFGSAGVLALAAALPGTQVDELGLESNGLEECILEPLGSAWAKRPFSRVRLSDNAIPRETIVNFVKTLKTIH